jgi:O-antigen ligase
MLSDHSGTWTPTTGRQHLTLTTKLSSLAAYTVFAFCAVCSYIVAAAGGLQSLLGVITIVTLLGVGVVVVLVPHRPAIAYLLPLAAAWWVPLVTIPLAGRGYTVTLLDIVMAVVVISLPWQVCGRDSATVARRAAVVGVFCVLVSMLSAVTVSEGRFSVMLGSALVTIKRYGWAAFVPLFLWSLPSTFRQDRALVFLAIAGLILAVSGILQAGSMVTTDATVRATGLAFNPNVQGMLDVVTTDVLIGIGLEHPHSRPTKLLVTIGMAVSLISLIMSASRGGLLGLVVSSALWAAWSLRTKRWNYLSILMGCVVCLVLLGMVVWVLPSSYTATRIASLFSGNDIGVAGRLMAWRYGWHLFLDHPLGVGAGNIGLVGANYVTSPLVLPSFAGTDNQYWDMALEAGLPGLALLITLLVLMGKLSSRGWPSGTSKASIACLVSTVVVGATGYTLFNPIVSMFVFYCCGLAGLPNSMVRRRGEFK